MQPIPYYLYAQFKDAGRELKAFDILDIHNNRQALDSALAAFTAEERIYFLPLELNKSIRITNLEPYGELRDSFKDLGILRGELRGPDLSRLITTALNYVYPECMDRELNTDDSFLETVADYALDLPIYSNNYLDILDNQFVYE